MHATWMNLIGMERWKKPVSKDYVLYHPIYNDILQKTIVIENRVNVCQELRVGGECDYKERAPGSFLGVMELFCILIVDMDICVFYLNVCDNLKSGKKFTYVGKKMTWQIMKQNSMKEKQQQQQQTIKEILRLLP